jgi:hypothetical protein
MEVHRGAASLEGMTGAIQHLSDLAHPGFPLTLYWQKLEERIVLITTQAAKRFEGLHPQAGLARD